MNTEQLASKLSGLHYRDEMIDKIANESAEEGLVVVYGISDDIICLEGAIQHEYGHYRGGPIWITKNGILPSKNDIDDDDDAALEEWIKNKKLSHKIEALWCEGSIAWTFKTDIPHSTFDIIRDEEVQCRGIVFNINNLI